MKVSGVVQRHGDCFSFNGDVEEVCEALAERFSLPLDEVLLSVALAMSIEDNPSFLRVSMP